MFNKVIQRIKLSITTDCNLNCKYCFVHKTSEVMDFGTAKKSVDLLLRSPGRDKILSIYGGEPMLVPGLLKKIIPYAAREARSLRKALSMGCSTNGTLITEDCLALFKEYGVGLHVSLIGHKGSHDKFRNFNDKEGSYDRILKNLSLMRKILPEGKLEAGFCVLPSQARHVEANFYHLVHDLGFHSVNFEIIRGFEPWTRARMVSFVSGYVKIIRYLMKQISLGENLYFKYICLELGCGYLSSVRLFAPGSARCLFRYSLEVYPSGDMAFSPFLLNSADRQRYLIGNINKGIINKFNSCRYRADTPVCKRCLSDYFSCYIFDINDSIVRDYFSKLSLQAVQLIQRRALTDPRFAVYISNAKKRIS